MQTHSLIFHLGLHCLPKNKFTGFDPTLSFDHMGLDVRKPVFGGLRTTQAQSDQRLCYSLIGMYYI